MGNIQKAFSKKEISDRILIQGLYNAEQKCTFLHKLKKLKVVEENERIPDSGTVENLFFNNLEFMYFEFPYIGGRCLKRPKARHYYSVTKAVVFVLDSTVGELGDHLEKYDLHVTAKEEALSDAVFLILANKQDLSEAMSVEEITEALELPELTQQWNIFGYSESSGEGLYEAFEWLSDTLTAKQRQEENTEMSQENTGKNNKTEGFLVKGIKEFKSCFLTVGKRKS